MVISTVSIYTTLLLQLHDDIACCVVLRGAAVVLRGAAFCVPHVACYTIICDLCVVMLNMMIHCT